MEIIISFTIAFLELFAWSESLLCFVMIVVPLMFCYAFFRLLNSYFFLKLIFKLIPFTSPFTHHFEVETKCFQSRWDSSAPLEICFMDLGFDVEHIFVLHEIGSDRTIKYRSILGGKQHD